MENGYNSDKKYSKFANFGELLYWLQMAVHPSRLSTTRVF